MIKEVEKRAALFSIKTGTAAAACHPDLTREKGVLKSPQAFQNPKLKIYFPLFMRRATRRAFPIVF